MGTSRFTVVSPRNRVYSCYHLLMVVLFSIRTTADLLWPSLFTSASPHWVSQQSSCVGWAGTCPTSWDQNRVPEDGPCPGQAGRGARSRSFHPHRPLLPGASGGESTPGLSHPWAGGAGPTPPGQGSYMPLLHVISLPGEESCLVCSPSSAIRAVPYLPGVGRQGLRVQ